MLLLMLCSLWKAEYIGELFCYWIELNSGHCLSKRPLILITFPTWYTSHWAVTSYSLRSVIYFHSRLSFCLGNFLCQLSSVQCCFPDFCPLHVTFSRLFLIDVFNPIDCVCVLRLICFPLHCTVVSFQSLVLIEFQLTHYLY